MGFSVSKTSARFALDAGTLATKLIEGRYPDWRRVIPTEFGSSVLVERALLVAALRRVGLATGPMGGISVTLDPDGLRLEARSEGGDEAAYFVPAELTGTQRVMGFNWKYLDAALEHCTAETIRLQVTPQGNSCLISDPEEDAAEHVVMPMRL